MGAETGIAWCDHTFNPWWGCFKISPGCDNCYAATFDKRVHGIGHGHWGPQADHRRFGDKHWREPEKWNRDAEKAGVRRRVFCASMADVFEGRPEDDADRMRLFWLIAETPHLDWLLLTKRPENMVRLAPPSWAHGWPLNVWAGTTCEDQQRADERIPHLLRVPAAVRFLSVEPQLGDIRLGLTPMKRGAGPTPIKTTGIDWVICGGESGPGARPFDLSWARSIIAQCREAGVAVFVKQMGSNAQWQVTDTSATWPLKDKKGGDMTEWPSDLRIQDWPR